MLRVSLVAFLLIGCGKAGMGSPNGDDTPGDDAPDANTGDGSMGDGGTMVTPCSRMGLPSVAWPTTNVAPIATVVGDFNKDGKPDIAVVNQTSNNASVVLGLGAGAFGPKADYTTGS